MHVQQKEENLKFTMIVGLKDYPYSRVKTIIIYSFHHISRRILNNENVWPLPEKYQT